MDFISANISKEVLNALTHFKEWSTISEIAESIKLNPGTVEKLCWNLTGKGMLVWRPGFKRAQLFRYAPKQMDKKETELTKLLPEIHKLLGRDYYITGETGLFLHGLTDYGMFQRKIEISLPRVKYNDLAAKLVNNLSIYATILPYELPKRCNREEIFADALERGGVIVLHKAAYNVRKLRFHGEYNLPDITTILAEAGLDESELLTYVFRAMEMGLSREDIKKLGKTKKILVYLKDYLNQKEIPNDVLKKIQEAVKNAKGY